VAGTDGLEVRHVLVKSFSMEMSIEVVSSKTGLGVLGALLDPIYMPFLHCWSLAGGSIGFWFRLVHRIGSRLQNYLWEWLVRAN